MQMNDGTRKLLDENRSSLNAKFNQRQSLGVRIDSQAFLLHLQSHVLPLVELVEPSLPERCNSVLQQLFDVSLDLFSVGYFAENVGILPDAINRLWLQTLPKLTPQLARDAARVAGCLSNAVLHIARIGEKSANSWLNKIEAVGTQTDSVEQLLQVAQVAAWLAGLPEIRMAALELAAKLPSSMVARLLDLSDGSTDSQVKSRLDRWRDYAWECSQSDSSNSNIVPVAICGAFVGFGGTFKYPPKVFIRKEGLFATDGQQVWQVFADSRGHTFRRANLAPEVSPSTKDKRCPRIDAEGHIHWEQDSILFPELSNVASQAFHDQTLAVTLPDSFQIILFARPGIDGLAI